MSLTSPTALCLLLSGYGALALSGHFWHITDLHWDPHYNMSNDPKSVCPSSGSQAVHNAGRWGDYLCDSPWDLINSSIYTMRHILPDPDFILWTGDDTPHVPNEELGEEKVLDIIANLTHILQEVFPDTKVYSAMGNHDFHPKSQLPAGENPGYIRTAELWERWLESSSVETFRKGAYYTERLLNKTGQRMIVLNTNLYYNNNNLTVDLQDPADQFKWLEEVLTSAAASKEKVYIIGHVPPGFFEKKRHTSWFRGRFNERYLEIIRKHHPVIAGQFFGHQHTDTFHMFYNNSGSPISAMFLAPGITPWKTTLSGVKNGANNPGIRVFEYDHTTLLIKDIVTYYLNLTHANLAGPRWEKEYRLTESFRVPDASARSMHEVLRQMETDDCALQRHYRFNSVSYDLSHCDWACRADHVCSIREVDFSSYEKCVVTEGVTLLSLAPVLLLLPATLSWDPMM
ncbi:acid sphingomyelinase-like phosphodiesterase 3b [Polyodon spathula]|uniref:acid sphingomyelinase-like phosphodiesterase 3b n=1 Tax=Polyodon spathula TaxID=7913 RepID=UPI001B7F5DD0|nr:acid sphingomyelinase-like phosphodiesterase 3b [Polyodon spathula]XP_041096409.1 acid sphingomyelinase-like phosphodiesterase 3b [Polyodon spathula]